MDIKKIESYQVKLPLVSPFKTSYGYLSHKAMDILVITDELGNQGYGELVAFEQPDYTEETIETARLIMRHHLIPILVSQKIGPPNEVTDLFSSIRGNWMAKSALETAIWDLYAKRHQVSLAQMFNSETSSLKVGVSIGIQKSIPDLLETVSSYIDEGYERIKLKIAPGNDIEMVKAVRKAYPTIPLMIDANSAYSLADISTFQLLDDYHLAMIEQPFSYSDFIEHAALQRHLKTPICLDENIRQVEDVMLAEKLGSARAINLKISRVGGITEAQKIVDYGATHGFTIWCGGMFESGVGRALNLAFASQKGFNFPGDISATTRYFKEDVINETFCLTDGKIAVPNKIGLGISLNKKVLDRYGSYHRLYNHDKK